MRPEESAVAVQKCSRVSVHNDFFLVDYYVDGVCNEGGMEPKKTVGYETVTVWNPVLTIDANKK